MRTQGAAVSSECVWVGRCVGQREGPTGQNPYALVGVGEQGTVGRRQQERTTQMEEVKKVILGARRWL